MLELYLGPGLGNAFFLYPTGPIKRREAAGRQEESWTITVDADPIEVVDDNDSIC